MSMMFPLVALLRGSFDGECGIVDAVRVFLDKDERLGGFTQCPHPFVGPVLCSGKPAAEIEHLAPWKMLRMRGVNFDLEILPMAALSAGHL